MSAQVRFLRLQYLLKKLDDVTIDNAVSNGILTQQEADFIKGIE